MQAILACLGENTSGFLQIQIFVNGAGNESRCFIAIDLSDLASPFLRYPELGLERLCNPGDNEYAKGIETTSGLGISTWSKYNTSLVATRN